MMDTKIKIVFCLVGDVIAEEVWTLEQVVLGKHKEWFDKTVSDNPEADWFILRA